MKAPIPDISRDLFNVTGYYRIFTGASMGIASTLPKDLLKGGRISFWPAGMRNASRQRLRRRARSEGGAVIFLSVL